MDNILLRIFCHILLFVQLSIASTLIQGKVTDAATNEPLPFTNIYLSGTTFGTAANDSGYYEFSAPFGSVEIVFSRIGYKPFIRHITIPTDSIVTVDAALKVSPIQTQQIEITAQDAAKRCRQMQMFENGFLGSSYNAGLYALESASFNFF